MDGSDRSDALFKGKRELQRLIDVERSDSETPAAVVYSPTIDGVGRGQTSNVRPQIYAGVSEHEELGECRICQEDDTLSNLESPCDCAGTVKYAHHECIQKWVNEKGNIKCEICGSEFKGEYTIPEPVQLRELRIEALAALPFLGPFRHRLFVREAAQDAATVEELQESAAASHRLSLTYCFTLILLILGMVLLHNTFAVMHKGDVESPMPSMSYEDNRTYYDYDAATGEFYPQGSQSHLGDPTMDMGVVMLWLLLRILVIILPLLVMMRVLQAMRERRAMEDQSLMVELQHVDLARIFQRMEAERYAMAPVGQPVSQFQRGAQSAPAVGQRGGRSNQATISSSAVQV